MIHVIDQGISRHLKTFCDISQHLKTPHEKFTRFQGILGHLKAVKHNSDN